MAVTGLGLPFAGQPGALAQKHDTCLGKLLMVILQLALVVLIIRQFNLEHNAVLHIVFLASLGFLVHYFLPLRYRLPFFVLLSFAGIGLVFGFPNGAWLLGIGLVLIGICHLPMTFRMRVVLLLLTGTGLAVLRVDWFHAPWSQAVWPIVGSMFMFRLIVYLHDLRHDHAPVSVWRTLAYFFLLPNVCFPLFPVVDYKTFRQHYYDDDPHRIYQVGVEWMARGVVHLILYRLVYHHLTLLPTDVTGATTLIHYMVANFFLYLRVSGQFHLIIGMLHLFGFRLPETHHHYYLASSFTDFWRRINIYWKDFMIKVVYYPTYFKLRTLGTTTALVLSTLLVFFITWFLHAYQWFWLRGSFPITAQDVLFWGTLALLVIINSLWEMQNRKKRAAETPRTAWRDASRLMLRIAGTFSVICILWSLWTSESLSSWLSLWSDIDYRELLEDRWLTTLLIVVVMLGSVVLWRIVAANAGQGREQQPWIFHRAAVRTTLTLALLLLLGSPDIYAVLGGSAATVIHSLRSNQLNRLDMAARERGYYEDLLMVDRFNSQLWEVYMHRPLDWLDVQGVGLARATGDFLLRELVPSTTTFTSRVTVRTNRWGMRDRDYEQQPAPDTYRIAVFGASPVMGMGVEDHETFETLLEERLNHDHTGGRYARYELLNFGASNYKSLQQLVMVERALTFAPQAIFYVATSGEKASTARHLAAVVQNRIDIPYEYLRDIVQRTGIKADTMETVALRRLKPYHDAILSWLYRQIVDQCKHRGIVPVWIYLPLAGENDPQEKHSDLLQMAAEAGFVVWNLSELYIDQEDSSVSLGKWDNHPNAKAHQLIADRLYTLLQESPAIALSQSATQGMRSSVKVPVQDGKTQAP